MPVGMRRDRTLGDAPDSQPVGGAPASDLDPEVSVAVLCHVGAATYLWDIASDRLSWSKGAAELLGVRSLSEISTGRRFAQWIDPAGPTGRYDAVFMGTDTGGAGDAGIPFTAEYRFVPPGGKEACWIEDCGRWHADADGRPLRARGLVHIVTERRARDEALIYRSDHDDLTGSLYRSRLTEELAAAIQHAKDDRGNCGFAIVAVDNLGPLNEAYGFDVGDELVAGVATRLAGTMRQGDVLGRLAGNKIGIVLNACSEESLRVAAERFCRTVGDDPIATSCGAVSVTVSIGAVVLPRYGRNAAEALSRAQEALSLAKRRGVASILLFDPTPGREATRRRNIAIASEVVGALNAGRVALALQPIVRSGDHVPVLHEGLCRLTAEDGSPIAPAEFIATVERLGIIRLIDHRMLDLAVAALLEDTELRLALNVSATTAMDGTWFARLAAHLRRGRTIASRLVVEVTETMAITDLERAIDFVRSLRDLGCRVALDDFGAGHTSFRNLRVLSADLVKIDGSFITDIANNVDDQVFVSTLVRLAKHIGMEVIAERVCAEQDVAVLEQIGVDYLQGYLFGEAKLREEQPEPIVAVAQA